MVTSPSPAKRRRLDPSIPFNVPLNQVGKPQSRQSSVGPLSQNTARAMFLKPAPPQFNKFGKVGGLQHEDSRKRSRSGSRGRSMGGVDENSPSGKTLRVPTGRGRESHVRDEDAMEIDEEETRPKTTSRSAGRSSLQPQGKDQGSDAKLLAQLQERASFLRREIRHLETTIQEELAQKEEQQDQQPRLEPNATDDDLSSLISSLLATSDQTLAALANPAPKSKPKPKSTSKPQTIITNLYPTLVNRANPLPELSAFNTLTFTSYSSRPLPPHPNPALPGVRKTEYVSGYALTKSLPFNLTYTTRTYPSLVRTEPEITKYESSTLTISKSGPGHWAKPECDKVLRKYNTPRHPSSASTPSSTSSANLQNALYFLSNYADLSHRRKQILTKIYNAYAPPSITDPTSASPIIIYGTGPPSFGTRMLRFRPNLPPSHTSITEKSRRTTLSALNNTNSIVPGGVELVLEWRIEGGMAGEAVSKVRMEARVSEGIKEVDKEGYMGRIGELFEGAARRWGVVRAVEVCVGAVWGMDD